MVSLLLDDEGPSLRATALENVSDLRNLELSRTANSDQFCRGAMSESTTPPDQPQPAPAPPPADAGPESRQDLLSRAQAFLTSPQIRDQDDAAKRKFLTDKGLTPAEVDCLLQGIVSVSAPGLLRTFKALMALLLPAIVAV